MSEGPPHGSLPTVSEGPNMSLRLRLFLLFGGLLALLVLAQWWWVRVLTRDLSSEIDEVASSVGHSVVAFFRDVGDGGAPRREVFECLGEGCENVTFVDEDVKVGHRAGAPDVEEHFGYSYRVDHKSPEDLPAIPPGAPEQRVQKHIKLHIENEDGARYLRLGGPSVERRVRIPQGFRDKLESLSRRLFLGSAGFLALGLILAAVLAHGVTVPLRQLSAAASRLGDGALGSRVPVAASGELGQALAAFNRMSGRLEELDQRNRELSARKHLGEIGEISRGLAHTLRNPLNALGLSVEELAARGDGTAAPDLAESARRQIRRIDSSLKSFLALASQSGGALAEVDLGELVEDVALEALQDSRGKVRLELESIAGIARLRAIEPELRAVLQALVVNAIEASPAGGRVTVRGSSPAADRWRLEIDDEGPGLPPEVRARLFTPHLSTKANGSGMGLFLAHRIATSRYRGSLELVDLKDSGGAVRGTRAILEIGSRQAEIEANSDV